MNNISEPSVESLQNAMTAMRITRDGMQRRMIEQDATIEQLQTVLRAAREKIVLYRQAHSGEYIGGMEYNALIHRIDAVLL